MITPDLILEVVAREFFIDKEAILSASRRAILVTARHTTVDFLRLHCGLTQGEASKVIGRDDPGTSGNAERNVANWKATDRKYLQHWTNIAKALS